MSIPWFIRWGIDVSIYAVPMFLLMS